MAGLALFAFLSFSILFSGVAAVSRTATIDDADAGPVPEGVTPLATVSFFPQVNGMWGNQVGGTGTMVTVPDLVESSFRGTYTAASNFAGNTPRSIVIDFFGTSITAYFTLSNEFPTECDVTLDGAQLFAMRHAVGSRTDRFSYQVPGVKYTNLQPGYHRLEIRVTPFTSNRLNYVSFDYAEYTYDDAQADAFIKSAARSLVPNTGSTPQAEGDGNQTAAIVGGTIGGAAVLASIILVIYFRSRRARDYSSTTMEEKVGMHHPTGVDPKRQSGGLNWRSFGSFLVRTPRNPPEPVQEMPPYVTQHRQPAERYSVTSSVSASTKAHPQYLHIGPDGNSQWVDSPSQVHRLQFNIPQGSPEAAGGRRKYSDDRLDSLGLHLNTIQTPKPAYQAVSPTSASIAQRDLTTSYQYSIQQPSAHPSGSTSSSR